MAKLTPDKLMTLEAYARARDDFRAEVMAHKKNRNVMLGWHVTLIFEDEMTMRYQVQEMLRAEKIFEEAGIRDELDAYNPLIPDGNNWKATMMIEYEDIEERRRMLAQLIGIEDRVWVQVKGLERVYAIADEDLERATGEKTSAVHFLRFELTPAMIIALRQGASLGMGVDHPAYQATLDPVPAQIRASLLHDLQG
jgi:glycerol-3-phosphate dehydrogenase subunit C